MKYLKLYEQLQSESEIFEILAAYLSVTEYNSFCINSTINNGVVDVDDSVDLYRKNLTKIPVKFGEVNGDFDCSRNQLTSLENSPTRVTGDFYCHENKLLTSLEFCPDYIDGDAVFEQTGIYEFIGIGKIGGNVFFVDTPINNIWMLFNDKSKIELFNYMDPIRPPEKEGEEPIVYIVVLNAFLEQIGKEPVTKVNGYKCL